MWIVPPSQAPAAKPSSSLSVMVAYDASPAKVAEIASTVSFFGRDTSSVVLGQRASFIIWPSTKSWLFPSPRSHDWDALKIAPECLVQPLRGSAPLTTTVSLL